MLLDGPPGSRAPGGAGSDRPEGGREAFYESALKKLRPGVSEIIIHVGYEAEVPSDRRGDDPFGSAWRQKDFDYVTGPTFRELLRQQDIHLISWRDLTRLRPAH